MYLLVGQPQKLPELPMITDRLVNRPLQYSGYQIEYSYSAGRWTQEISGRDPVEVLHKETNNGSDLILARAP